ncbi:S-adenosyl-L-methionine-binding protein [Variibacter gotjawalensis]|uniref:S-adenosyl-L-methionine-binding protein n=1 Tax=Variibacter gotjawalensis TaxID=1333996 RepID=A0A0S3PVN1_9BRAD|nr:tRNA (N6-threonylcarbamoyladenosine(37)-N6)-methyltransferase TrmO [Variibacter gotjawalensis]NIK45725.1 tRNA-Thr(GGU) m(6)t(6)A37 methyltransferase TsaA [Variibacter gotjawalensis]RZS47649.1 tRNA-Thr(GGU) m(6)t(6)A37 methyltransferase TsaA [Variibacter gotjawalensis]BAT59902.1 S-adenosyl-L-methionine-binding protein [Variibacter gotjawalensis]
MNDLHRPGDTAKDLREGEVAVDLPADFDAGVYFIGRIHTPWKTRSECPKNARASDAICTVELEERWEAALKDVAGCTHLLLLYWMHEARRDLVLQKPRHYEAQRGTFSIRSPVRPNPIAASVAALIGIDGRKLSIRGIDCIDGTPLVDIKPYFSSVDSVPNAVVNWHASGTQRGE